MMAKEKLIQAIAELERRPSDLTVPHDQLEQYQAIAMLAGIVKRLEGLPNTLVVRRYKQGEVICRQGEAGWTAFYILIDDEVTKFFEKRKQLNAAHSQALDAEISRWKEHLAQVRTSADTPACSVFVAIPAPPKTGEAGLLGRLLGRRERAPSAPKFIPIDAATDLDYETKTASIRSGELFGEMSCLNRSPRSATIVAAHDIYVVEMLRNILDILKKDAKFQQRLADAYRQHLFDQQFRNLPLFQELPEEQINEIRKEIKLLTFQAGQIICDEHGRSEGMYVIRTGIVQVLKNASALLRPADLLNATELWQQLRGTATADLPEPDVQRSAQIGAFAAVLPEALRQRLAQQETPRKEDKATLLNGLNFWLENPPAWELLEFRPIFERMKDKGEALKKDWKAKLATGLAGRIDARQVLLKTLGFPKESEVRQAARRHLEALFPTEIAKLPERAGPDWVLNYSGRGEPIGEISLIDDSPHTATCVAFTHPDHEAENPEDDRVEVVWLPAEVFRKMRALPAVEKHLSALVKRRKAASVVSVAPAPDRPPLQSARFNELGLVQGQQLMLVDLDRCTRCDECVRACVNSHTDGRSRLFLDGPRLDHFLVPASCRSCRDPVCMIGCPVGSIRRGDNRQIVIEHWCIGCGLCAEQCPYGSIQMHDIGLISAGARGWRWSPVTVEGTDWTASRLADQNWRIGQAPFGVDWLSQPGLPSYIAEPGSPRPAAIGFRYEFNLTSALLKNRLELTLWAPEGEGPAAPALWVNGQAIEMGKGQRERKSEYQYPARWTRTCELTAGGETPQLKSGRNILAVRVPVPTEEEKTRKVLFDLRLDMLLHPDLPAGADVEYSQKTPTLRAVVCDLCSDLPGQRPACVSACPHDAAMRVDSLRGFPGK